MNTDHQDIKSYKKPKVCENLCPNLILFQSRMWLFEHILLKSCLWIVPSK